MFFKTSIPWKGERVGTMPSSKKFLVNLSGLLTTQGSSGFEKLLDV